MYTGIHRDCSSTDRPAKIQCRWGASFEREMWAYAPTSDHEAIYNYNPLARGIFIGILLVCFDFLFCVCFWLLLVCLEEERKRAKFDCVGKWGGSGRNWGRRSHDQNMLHKIFFNKKFMSQLSIGQEITPYWYLNPQLDCKHSTLPLSAILPYICELILVVNKRDAYFVLIWNTSRMFGCIFTLIIMHYFRLHCYDTMCYKASLDKTDFRHFSNITSKMIFLIHGYWLQHLPIFHLI